MRIEGGEEGKGERERGRTEGMREGIVMRERK